ncbi:MBOAT family O-acyltransferase [Methylomonas sp. 11b]|uniref:MBOAT family O-acyltransferase n=1 Tax=Methylomonas sp. 11b TaxID=1168169 RepID=UPI00047DB825|nr:MBOAT family O-acyltransferase [Methylomonas sp. 11b]
MLFSSPVFFVFFSVYFLLHFVIPKQFRIYLIILGSTIFYGWWRIEYIWLPYLLTAIAYLGVICMNGAVNPVARKRLAVTTVIGLFLPLVFYKYTDFFFRELIGPFVDMHDNLLNLPLPLGLSFVTFTLAAYVIDIYKGRFQATSSLSTVLAYVLFFPHLIAGPILRPAELLPQLERQRIATLRRFAVPLTIFSLGLVKKLVFADQVGFAVDDVYKQNGTLGAPDALLAIYGFSVQIYCDFSGYTDMAIGLALAIGIHLPNNFRRPYAARSLSDLWTRWHITLSFWFRDYLFQPLGGYRHGRFKAVRNILITMLLSGLWHGANWTFLIWGLLHGIGISVNYLLRPVLRGLPSGKMPDWIGVLLTFHFFAFAAVFFRSPTIAKALNIWAAPFIGGWGGIASFAHNNIFPLLLILVFFALHRFDDIRKVKFAAHYLRPELLWTALVFCWLMAITVSQGNTAAFIYFDF